MGIYYIAFSLIQIQYIEGGELVLCLDMDMDTHVMVLQDLTVDVDGFGL